ncbi:cobalt/nickel transport protein [Paucidesulfovibrio gracilis DSM 16080]|uniref:Cobalt/nickel transport protein n=1 Tax=Paucidesulfovibrio gracilis DSM 16080 TaxID=1121449 RepID=A0A1T4WK34_9BACT|nr:DUF4198 domain-containing protein [Paucidesulfovibrio gracilis]SKA77682.1 cobalt/nickel transport protein [Paucidesulfovibrio gracilis DSM 16080]
MKFFRISMMVGMVLLLLASNALAHFGMVIPERDQVTQEDKSLGLTLSFSHPFEGHGMDLVKPEKFDVYFEGKATSLLETLKPATVMDHKAWTAEYAVKRPGMYTFVMEPKAYPEPAEDNYIIHYTKTVVDAFEGGEEWNQPLGIKTEIVPLTRPFGNYAGNVFQGVVLVDGEPAPYVRVEVEYYNQDGSREAPTGRMITQEVLADGNGVFTFACPWKGWWGFAALTDADYKIEGKDVELGAVLWVEMQ